MEVMNGAARIAVRVAGEVAWPTLILLPGLGRPSSDLDPFARLLLAARYRVVQPEPRGIGPSTGPLEGLTLHDLAGDIASVIEAVGVQRVTELIPWAAGAKPADLARLAPVVLEVAATGDLRANSLVTLAIEELGLHVRALARLLFGDERAAFQLAFNGGLLQRGSLLRRRLEQRGIHDRVLWRLQARVAERIEST